jgi:hypothetical protein
MGLVQHDDMSTPATDHIRAARVADAAQLLLLWALVFDDETAGDTQPCLFVT